MVSKRAINSCFFSVFFFFAVAVHAQTQRVFVNTPTAFFELVGGAGSCTYQPLANDCVPPFSNNPFSMAVFKDTIYYLDGATLRSFKLGVPGSCRTYTNIGSYTSMTVDPNGILYFASNQLIRYDPYLNQTTNLGTMPFSSGGDLIFFNGKLLMAGLPAAIYEIDIANPGASTLYMGTNGITFFGLMSFPVPCGNSRYFGLSPAGGGTDMYELDLINKTVLGNNCQLGGLNVYDAGSTTEGGVNAGISVTSLQVTQPCPPAVTGSINIQAVLAGFTVSYTLDNLVTNTTGIFPVVAIGPHSIRMTADNCTLDTLLNIVPGLNPAINVQQTNPDNCDGNNGVVTLSASSGHLPITYTLVATGQQSATGAFTNLLPGMYTFNIKDAAGCTKDKPVTIVLQPAPFVLRAVLDNAHCGNSNGFAKLSMAGNDTIGVLTSLAGAAFLPKVSYYGLAPGVYNLKAKRGAYCNYDTTFTIANVIDPKPLITIQPKNQYCFDNNGSIEIKASAPGYTFDYRLNTGVFGSASSFGNLAPGLYQLSMRNEYGCQWDTTATVQAYPKVPVFKTAAVTNPECTAPASGSIRVTVSGVQGPYRLLLNNALYSNGQLITGLGEGEYTVKIWDIAGCVVDTVLRTLSIPFDPRCNNIFVPNAFTPNGDGTNDFFRPQYASFLKNFRLQVFNRYGQQVYQGNGSGVQWDGRFKGTVQPRGGYVYYITYTDYFGVAKREKGSVLLLR